MDNVIIANESSTAQKPCEREPLTSVRTLVRKSVAGPRGGPRDAALRPAACDVDGDDRVDLGVEVDRDLVRPDRADGLVEVDVAAIDGTPACADSASAMSAAVTEPNSLPSSPARAVTTTGVWMMRAASGLELALLRRRSAPHGRA